MVKEKKEKPAEKPIEPPVEVTPPVEAAPIEPALPLINDEPALEQLAADMPHVEAEAVQAAQDKENIAQEPIISDKLDRLGRKFDAAVHSVDAEGKPKITVDGYLMMKRGNKGKLIMPERTGAPGVITPDKEAINRRYTAEVAAGLYIQTGIAIFGDEWQPEKSKDMDERQNLVNATDDYFKVVGFKELPPWAGLAVAYGSYGLRRFNRPVTKTKMQKAGEWIKNKIAAFYLWRMSRKNKKPGAPLAPEKQNIAVEVPEKPAA